MRYEEPVMDIMELEEYDVITLSGGTGTLDGDGDERLPGGWI